jgi:gluconolactonase
MIEVHEPALLRLLAPDAAVERLAAGFAWAEGPLWVGDSLLFSDVVRNRIVRWRELPEGPEVTTFRYPSGFALPAPYRMAEPGSNGLTLDRQRRLIACEHGNRRVSRTEDDGSVVALAERWDGRRLNSPNDVVVRSDGTIYFTDPYYGLLPHREDQELPFQGLFRIDPDGALHLAADDFEGPNGLALTPDERTLYVCDADRHHVRAFAVSQEGDLSDGRVLLAADSPDGLKVDGEGNVYLATIDSIRIFAPDGSPLGRVVLPERPSNLAWGDADWSTLYVTATTGLYRVRTLAPGIPVG